ATLLADRQVTVTAASINRRGRQVTLDLLSSADTEGELYYRGQMVILYEWGAWGSGGDIPSAHHVFVGYVDEIRTESDVEVPSQFTLTLVSPLRSLESMSFFPHVLSYSPTSANWQEAIAALMHLDYFVFYLLYYHTTLLELFDFYPGGLAGWKGQVFRT